MRTRRAQRRAWLAVPVLLMLLLAASGCRWFGSNFGIGISIPLGLNGTIGLLNPDGGVIGPGVEPPTGGTNGTIIPPDTL